MRDKSSVVSGSGRPVLSGTDNHEMGHSQGEDIAGSQNGRPRRRNKKNARQQGVEVHPDQDKSYVGNVPNVDYLVEYINNLRSAENLKENLNKTHGPSPAESASATRIRNSKRKERNRGKTSEISGIGNSDETHTPTSDADLTSLVHEHTVAKQTESENRFGGLDAEGKKEMGNSSSSGKIDASEVETLPSSSKTDVVEPETNSKETEMEQVKHEAAKNQKNHLLSNSKDLSTIKHIKNDNKDTAKADGEDQKETKTKNSKKGKSTIAKKDSQKPEIKKKLTSPSSPTAPEVDVDSSQEQWCTVLSKPQKKRKRSQGQTMAMGQNGYTLEVTQQASSKGFLVSSPSYSFEAHAKSQHHTAFRRPNIKTRSYTPSYPEAAVSESVEKDLSPNDFPVLPVKLYTSSCNYHRSCENIFDTSSLNNDKDSDKESSKSYPADLGVIVRGRADFPVSYATKASRNTAHESADSSKAESVSSSVEDSSVEFSANSTSSLKWKGSPQERRHSIGSAPKEFSKNTLQRTGSQEMLPRDKDTRSPSVTIPSHSTNSKNLVPSDSTSSFTVSDADSAHGSEIGSEVAGEDFSPTPPFTGTTPHSGTTSVSVENKQTGVHDGEKLTNMSTENVERKATVTSIPIESALTPRSQRAVKTETSGAKQVKIGQKRGGESFTFCYKTFTSNGGVHFGFFLEEELFSIATKTTACACDKHSELVSAAEESSKAVLSQPLQDDSDSSNSPSRASQQPLAAAHSVSSSNNFPSKPSKGPHIAGLNGLVFPQNSDIGSTLVLPTSTNPLPISEQTPTCSSSEPSEAKQLTARAPVCAVSLSNSLEAAENNAEPVGESQDRIVFTYGPNDHEPQKCAVYLRPPDEMTTKIPSQDLIDIKKYFWETWLSEWKMTWEKAENHPSGSVHVYESGKKY